MITKIKNWPYPLVTSNPFDIGTSQLFYPSFLLFVVEYFFPFAKLKMDRKIEWFQTNRVRRNKNEGGIGCQIVNGWLWNGIEFR